MAAEREVAGWLEAFGKALANHDIAGATLLFDAECYWRDLVSFTWNIKTMEGRGSHSRSREIGRAHV